MTDPIPTAEQISVFGSLDEQQALRHFLGKDLLQAEALFRENFICYQEDLMWMGPKAFCFYVSAAMNYLLSNDSDNDADGARSFLAPIGFQFEYHAREIATAIPGICEGMTAILGKMDRFKCDPGIDGDVAERYKELIQKLKDFH